MSVLVECFSVIVPVAVLEAKFPGGSAAYSAACPNQTYCSDGRLTRVGFMVPQDAAEFADSLEALGLCISEQGRFIDVAIVDQLKGLFAPCTWLQFARHPDGYGFAWDQGDAPGVLAVPEDWVLEDSLSTQFGLALDTSCGELIFLRSEPGLDVYRNPQTDREVYIGRVPSAPLAGAGAGE